MRYSVDGVIETPDGRNARLRAVWLIDEYRDRPESGRIAVKVINRLGDEVMEAFQV